MKLLGILFLITLFIVGCENYENKKSYAVNIDETVKVYYSTNSCCKYCLENEQELKHVKLVDIVMVDAGPNDCDGCNYTKAYIFKAISVGTDTIKLKEILGGEDCNNTSDAIRKEVYLVNVVGNN